MLICFSVLLLSLEAIWCWELRHQQHHCFVCWEDEILKSTCWTFHCLFWETWLTNWSHCPPVTIFFFFPLSDTLSHNACSLYALKYRSLCGFNDNHVKPEPWRRAASHGPADSLTRGVTQDSVAVMLTLPEGVFQPSGYKTPFRLAAKWANWGIH